MGAPKQKWTAEEEAALKAGVVKYGAGKWRTILTDPDFSTILRMRSNVDLKDKWRNINVTAIWGSRQKAKLALKKNLPPPVKSENNHATSNAIVPYNQEVAAAAKPLTVSGGTSTSKEQIPRLDNLILEAIVKLKEPKGSDISAIAAFIEDQYRSPPNLIKILSSKLKHMVANGKLIKVNQKYRIATNSSKISEKRRCSSLLLLEGRPNGSPKEEKADANILSKSQVDVELLKMKGVTAQEVAAAAAKAVAEAEAAIAEAETAAREAEAAEAEAEAARVFAKAAQKALKCRRLNIW